MTPPPDDAAFIGRSVGGRFSITRRLGAGGMGAVYAATDAEGGGEVAVKVLLPELAREKRHLARFRREAEVMGLLDHPHVVRAIATGVEEDGTPWLAMELVAGQTLSKLMRGRGATLGVEEAVGLARQVVSALTAAHEVGVVHRDLKPGNLMLTRDADGLRVKVLDFGLARFAESATYEKLTMTGVVVGTPSYMAPEQAFGDSVDQRTDLYAVGAILHAMLTGQAPFGSGKSPTILPRLLANERERLTETRRDLGPIVEVVERLLEPEPEHRYQTAAELDAALAPFDAKVPSTREWTRPPTMHTLALPPDPVLDAPRPRKRPRTVEQPALGAAQTSPAEPEAIAAKSPRRGARGAMLGAALVLATATSAAVVYFALKTTAPATSSAARVAGQDASAGAVAPVALGHTPDAAGGRDATASAESGSPDAALAVGGSEAPRASAPEDRAPADPVTAAYAVRIEVRASHVPVDRLRGPLTNGMSVLHRCLAEVTELHRPPPYVLRLSYNVTPGGVGRTLGGDSASLAVPSGVYACVSAWVDSLRLPQRDGRVHVRLTLTLTAADAPRPTTIVDGTTPAPDDDDAPKLRVFITLQQSDVPHRMVAAALTRRNANLSRCLDRGGPMSPSPPYRGTLGWAWEGRRYDFDFEIEGRAPGWIAACIENALRPVSLPLRRGDRVHGTFRANAADESGIWLAP